MRKTASFLRWQALLLSVLVLALVGGCAQAPAATPETSPTPIPTIRASLLVQVSESDSRWLRDVEVPKGVDAYEFTELATQGDLRSTWYPAFRAHFVEVILGVENQGSSFWLIFLWDEGEEKWNPLPVGADLFSVKEGHVLAWAYTDTSQSPGSLPIATP